VPFPLLGSGVFEKTDLPLPLLGGLLTGVSRGRASDFPCPPARSVCHTAWLPPPSPCQKPGLVAFFFFFSPFRLIHRVLAKRGFGDFYRTAPFLSFINASGAFFSLSKDKRFLRLWRKNAPHSLPKVAWAPPRATVRNFFLSSLPLVGGEGGSLCWGEVLFSFG